MALHLRVLLPVVLAGLVAAAAPAHAQFGGGGAYPVTLSATATDLADGATGQDRWRFDFTVTGDMAQGDVLAVLLGDIYADLVNLTPSVPGQFDTAIDTSQLTPQYRLTDTGGNAATQSFSVGLVLSPTIAVPGSLSVASLYNSVSGITGFRTVTIGLVPAAPVPEAGTASLLALGLVALAIGRRRRVPAR